MSTPNQPQDPYSSPEGSGAQSGGPSYPGSSDSSQGGQVPQYGQYAPQDGGAGQYGSAPQYGTEQPGAYPSYQGQNYGQAGVYGYPKNNLGVWALVLGIAGVVICGPAGIAAIIVGNNSKKAVARGEANNGGMATAGVVLGWVAVALWVIGIILFATGVFAGLSDTSSY